MMIAERDEIEKRLLALAKEQDALLSKTLRLAQGPRIPRGPKEPVDYVDGAIGQDRRLLLRSNFGALHDAREGELELLEIFFPVYDAQENE